MTRHVVHATRGDTIYIPAEMTLAAEERFDAAVRTVHMTLSNDEQYTYDQVTRIDDADGEHVKLYSGTDLLVQIDRSDLKMLLADTPARRSDVCPACGWQFEASDFAGYV
jgi:hypothetical protein